MAAKNRNTFEKLQRESQKKRKAALKRQRREERKNAPAVDATDADATDADATRPVDDGDDATPAVSA